MKCWLGCIFIFFAMNAVAAKKKPRKENFSSRTTYNIRAQWLTPTSVKYKPRSNPPPHAQFELATETSTVTLDFENKRSPFLVFKVPPLSLPEISTLIRSSLKFRVLDNNKKVIDETFVQLSGLLDTSFTYAGNDLGVSLLKDHRIQIKVWAPTALSVRLWLSHSSTRPSPKFFDKVSFENGVWTFIGPADWLEKFYMFEVTVFMPQTEKMETHLVTDPYSLSLSENSQMSQIVDMNSANLKPTGWDLLQKPKLENLQDAVVYELHMRDATSSDENLPKNLQGTYLGLVHPNSKVFKHLQSLAVSGLTHIHFLPFTDFGSVNEKKTTWPKGPSGLDAPDSQTPQQKIGSIRKQDAYNWGYDPVHWLTPEGSYATDPMGSKRILEMRQMIQTLNQKGLRVVMDLVFNHTYAQGKENFSVLDKIVPLYYYRTDEEGNTYQSSCCNDTASEHKMMEKLMIDTVISWVRHYKIDGFRFDLLNLHTKQNVQNIRAALQTQIAKPGSVRLDASKILIYGEAWPFGSYYDQNSKQAFTQLESFGMNVGVYNDRLRDAVRGGTTNPTEKSDPGFVTGLYYDFNEEPANRNTPISLEEQKSKLLNLQDVISLGLAGNLRNFYFENSWGQKVKGEQVSFRGSPVAYAASPIETINYVSAHDGYSLWDAIQAKAPFQTNSRQPLTASIDEKVQMQILALGTVLLAQGIPSIEGGSEILRSKSGDTDSYDSGDHFNSIDFGLTRNGWGQGLPPAWKNQNDWSFWQPRLRSADLKAQSSHMQKSLNAFKALLKIRQSSPLFKLKSDDDVQTRVSFLKSHGQNRSTPGMIAMHISDEIGNDLDPNRKALLIFFNAHRLPQSFTHEIFENEWRLIFPYLSMRRTLEIPTLEIPARSILILER